MDNDSFDFEQLTCCSLILHWKVSDETNLKSFELYQREGDLNFVQKAFSSYDKIYEGNNNTYELINLKPNQVYDFKLKIIKTNSMNEKEISVKTLKSPHAILSEKSVEVANEDGSEQIIKLASHDILDYQMKLIKNCAKFLFEENNEYLVKGDFDGIIIKITHEGQSNTYYISFDIKDDYFNEFFKRFIKGIGDNILIPCHFILEKLPSLLFLDLIKKGSVIFTGKRMGGVIASSLVFYLLYMGKSIDRNYENALFKRDKKCIGAITFGSPAFLTNLTAAVKMKELTSYFFNIKDKYDFIPAFIDFLNEKKLKSINENISNLFHKEEFTNNNITVLNNFFKEIKFTEDNLKKFINQDIKIPFGYYYMMENNSSLVPIDEKNFQKFYYFIKFLTQDRQSNLKKYKVLSSNIIFNKEELQCLEKKNYELELVKIIRRKIESKTKAIIKFKLVKFDNITISPDLIDKITLTSNDSGCVISNKDIYYDNDTDITAYRDELHDNVNNIIISNKFQGEIKVKQILNIQGSGPTEEMLKNNIEKLFLIPFFKLFEIFYISFRDENNFQALKEQNFGKNYEKIKILKPFEKQIEILNELLFLSRPDLLAKSEKELIQKYIYDVSNKEWTEEQKNNLNYNFSKYYQQAKQIQVYQAINCIESELYSIAKKNKFPLKILGENKKLFMTIFNYSETADFINTNFNNNYIKNFFIEIIILKTLQKMENDIKNQTNNLSNENEYKEFFNKNIGKFYDSYIIPNIYFIRLIILITIEGGDFIKFNHTINLEKYSALVGGFFCFIKIIFGMSNMNDEIFKYYGMMANNIFDIFIKRVFKGDDEKDFDKYLEKNEIEEQYMKNLFYKNKTRKIIKSNISNTDSTTFIDNIKDYYFKSFKNNKVFDFSQYSEKCKIGKEYYTHFIEILNNYSNDFIEDTEISIYDNLKEENKKREDTLSNIKNIMKGLIDDEESKKGFLALLRQSYLIGKLRVNIVRNNFI